MCYFSTICCHLSCEKIISAVHSKLKKKKYCENEQNNKEREETKCKNSLPFDKNSKKEVSLR